MFCKKLRNFLLNTTDVKELLRASPGRWQRKTASEVKRIGLRWRRCDVDRGIRTLRGDDE